jgi:hypothetical protein
MTTTKSPRYEYQRLYRERNKERIRLQKASRREVSRKLDNQHYARTKERHRELWASKKYGISIETYREMAKKNACDVCGEPEIAIGRNGEIKRFAIDHDHQTGRVRGVLCQRCNQAIGLLREDTELMKKAIHYLNAQSA